MIKAVLIDIDDTIIDFKKSVITSLNYSFETCKLEYSDKYLDIFLEINDDLWKKVEKQEITREDVYATRWNTIFNLVGIDYDGIAFENIFRGKLGETAEPVENAYGLLEYLKSKYPLYAASNSTLPHQLKRLAKADMLGYFTKVLTSDIAGANKPSKLFFDYCFKEIGDILPEDTVMIGDSLTSDIEGGITAGMKTIWFNPNRKTQPSGMHIDHTVTSLLEIKNIL